jgi:hypothetical protein
MSWSTIFVWSIDVQAARSERILDLRLRMTPEVKTFDGVGFLSRGDAAVVVYRAPARLHRSRWLYYLADRAARDSPDGIVVLMVILPTADPPDGPTRGENTTRMRKLAPSLRRFVTVAIGDDLRLSVVRTVMRALAVLQGKSKVHFIENTLEDGVSRLLEAAGPKTPGAAELMQDVEALYEALGCGSDGEDRPTPPDPSRSPDFG